MDKRTDFGAVVDLTQARIERLEADELRTLAAATGHHLPVELAYRVEQLRAERFVLASAELPPAA